MNKILIIGPFPEPISGVSLANKVVKEVLENSNDFQILEINTSYPIFEDAIGRFSFKKLIFFLKINFKFTMIFNSDIVYITPGQTFFGILKYSFFILLSSVLGKELIIHVHGNYLGTQYNKLQGIKKKTFHFLISKFTKGIVLSKSLMTNLTPFISHKRIHILNNFAEDYLIDHSQQHQPDKLHICYLSNLMEEKGIFYLLEALQGLEKRNIPYIAKIAGNIDEEIKGEILKKINNLKNTTYLGLVYKGDKKELLNWSTIFVLPTFYKMEGQPISIIEALATGNVIITTNHAGIPDIISHKINGYIVPQKDGLGILNILLYLHENKNQILNISNYNKTYFVNNFTLKKFETEIIKIINC